MPCCALANKSFKKMSEKKSFKRIFETDDDVSDDELDNSEVRLNKIYMFVFVLLY